MSQHPLLTSLPTELQLIIYQFVLCPPEGVKVYCSSSSILDPLGDPPLLATTQPINLSILRVCKGVYPIAWDALYSDQYEFILNLSVALSRAFLGGILHGDALRRIRTLSFTRAANTMSMSNIVSHAASLVQEIIVPRMSGLQFISVAVPDDLVAAASLGISAQDEYHWFVWDLTDCLVRAFISGHFTYLRFVHPRLYPNHIIPYLYHNVAYFLQPTILGDDTSTALVRQSALAMDHFREQYRHSGLSMPSFDLLREESDHYAAGVIENAWNSSGFSLATDVHECLDTQSYLTVLVLRRHNKWRW